MAEQTKKKKEFQMPHTYVIIFGVILFCWLLTFLVPLGKYDTHDVTYIAANGKEKTKTVLIPESFRYQYNIDNAKLKAKLTELAANDAKLAELEIDKAALQEAISADPIDTDALAEDLGIDETVLYDNFGESIYDTSKTIKEPALFWGTEDYEGRLGVLNYVFEGLVTGDKWGSAVGIVAFILVIGGAFGIVMRTGAIDAGIYAIIDKIKFAGVIIIPVMFIIFAFGGAIFGMSEECAPFTMMIVPFVVALGYDSLIGVAITFVATQVGNAASWMNPFGVAVAQGIAGVPVLSGAPFRMIMFAVFLVVAVVYLYLYAAKIKKNPQASIVYEQDSYWRERAVSADGEKPKFSLGHGLVLLTLLAGIIWIVYGVTEKQFYIPEIASQFFVIGLVSGIFGAIFKLNDMGINDIASSFSRGAADLAGAAIVVGMAKGILIVLGGSDAATPTVLNTVLHATGSSLAGLPSAVTAVLMYCFQTIFNFFVTSNSGQAALTMPILAPLADIVGLTRQIAVLAYQLGSGFADAIVPTSASLMAVLGVARIDWNKWFKWQIKMQGVLFLTGCVFMVIAVMVGLS